MAPESFLLKSPVLRNIQKKRLCAGSGWWVHQCSKSREGMKFTVKSWYSKQVVYNSQWIQQVS